MAANRQPAIDLRQLSYFVAIAETGTISSAARKVGISQPSLSEALTKLEQQLSVKLVVRNGRGTQLTEAGAALARYSSDIFRNLDLALEEVRHLGGEARGPVAVGLPPSIALLLSVPLAETVRQELPSVKLRLTEAMSGYVLDWIKNEHIDLAVLYQGQDCRHLDSHPLMTEELFVVAAPDNWPRSDHANGVALEPIAFPDLQELPLVLPSRPHGLRELVERHARTTGTQLDVVTEIDALRHIVTMVSRASAYTILPHAAVMNEVTRGDLMLIPITKPMIKRTAYIARKRGRPVTRASLVVENLISEILNELIQRHKLNAQLPNTTSRVLERA